MRRWLHIAFLWVVVVFSVPFPAAKYWNRQPGDSGAYFCGSLVVDRDWF
jgi:hypothetical protein